MQQPIDNIVWVDVNRLDANDYNPNVVIGPEFALLKLSLLKQGWIQPVLVSEQPEVDGVRRYTIIDGFHRSTLCKTDKEVAAMTYGKVPCAILSISEAERKMLTVRINRAKGAHIAAKMHELIVSLVNDHRVSITDLCKELGAEKSEIELLLQENVFTKMKTAEHAYSRAWTVKEK